MEKKWLRWIHLFAWIFVYVCQISATGYEIPRLSPLPVKQEMEALSLNGTWQFSTSPEDCFWMKQSPGQWQLVEVPGQWVMQGFEVEKGKAAGYFRTFSVPESWKGKRIKLRCNGIYSESTIYINGHEVRYHLGGFTPFESDITSFVRTGEENRIAVTVVSESLADSTSNASQYAVHPLGGITRDIYLFVLPEVNLSSFHASTGFDNDYTHAMLTAEVEVANESNTTKNAVLQFVLTDAAGKEIPLSDNNLPLNNLHANEKKTVKVSFDIVKPEQWNSEHPYLYNFTCRLKTDDRVLHTTTRRIGFRQIEVKGNELFINNRPIKLRGVCRHEVMPLRGRSLTGDIWKKDVELFKKGNVNYIRTSHYPPDEALLDACDELGMFVEVEAPFCWAHQTKVPADKHHAVLINQHLEMVNRDKSHPSVIIWSLGNESNLYAEYFKKSGEIIKEIDPTRPRVFSQWGPDADDNELEIGNHHYPGPGGPDKYRKSLRPVLFDEFCHLNAYNRFELASDPGIRSMWGRLLDDMWNNMYYSKGVLGGALWAGIDDTFFLPGGRPVGYGTWGPIDGWRREKPEYWDMKKAFSPVRISMKQNTDPDGNLYFNVENRFNFTNLSSCKILWSISSHDGVVSVDLEPRTKGIFKINIPSELQNSKTIAFTIHDAQGYIIDQYDFRLLPEYSTSEVKTGKKKLNMNETEDYYAISSPNVTIRVNKKNGLIDVLKNEQLYLENAPSLMILPLNGSGDGIQMTGKEQFYEPYNPVCEDWTCSHIRVDKGKNEISVIAEGDFREATGKFVYTLTSDEELLISYQFRLKKEVSPRQTGLVFRFSETFKTLSWKRKGYWNVYPRNHIAALEGRADVADAGLPVSGIAGPEKEPTVDWSYDQTKNGSNMFRSTKENIRYVSLSDENRSFTVLSDGTQHARSWKDNGFTWLLIADYTNPGGEGYLSSHSEKYYYPLKKGDCVSGMIRILLQ